ncbi:hypothetical protein SEPCBS119000_005677 [Sporothrix epigloea]|uniref:BTB domain transcription factor n=1 Tax=Sporothrix epigloea TaxID=1892477 RepID=A0ABP0E013_9PEZI
MVETRRGTRTNGAAADTAKPAAAVKTGKTAEATEVKEETQDLGRTGDKPGATAGHKHGRSPSPGSDRESQKKLHTTASSKERKDNGDEVEKEKDDDAAAGDDSPSILEKGNIYFFFRARVNTDEPHRLADVARTYIIVQPQPEDGAKRSSSGHCRLLALPKKVLPQTGRDRFMAFVTKADASYAELESQFLTGSEAESQAKGDANSNDQAERHYPAATAVGEGVYAIIGTSRESHLVYVLSVPDKLGAVQKQLGLTSQRGCFLVSTKNPAFPMPGGAKMAGGGPQYPKEIQDSFRSLRWVPMRPEHLNYANSHLLLIGESKGADSILTNDHDGRELSAELEELADEDVDRMRRLGSTEAEAVFASLHAEDQAKDQPELAETFG